MQKKTKLLKPSHRTSKRKEKSPSPARGARPKRQQVSAPPVSSLIIRDLMHSASHMRAAAKVLGFPTDLAGIIDEKPSLLLEFPDEWIQLPTGASLNGQVTYRGYITYSDHGRNDRSSDFSVSSPKTGCRIDLNQVLVGGKVHIQVSVPIRLRNGQTRVDHIPYEGTIIGVNPTKAEIRAAIGPIELQVIAYKESCFRQFDDSDYAPVFGPPRGFGIMQLDTPPPTYRQIWDWRANIQAGKALYDQKRHEVEQHFANTRTAHPEAPALSADQFSLALYQYYNGGFYWSWNSVAKRWEKSGATVYGDDCQRVETLVRAGTPPSDWS